MDGGGDMGGYEMGGSSMGGYDMGGGMSFLQNASKKSRLEQATAEFSVDNSKEMHQAEFKKRMGMTPWKAYKLIFGWYMIIMFGWVAQGMGSLDYLLFYGEFDLEYVVLIRTTQRALEGVLVFCGLPLLGRIADRVGRKNIMLIGMAGRLVYITQLTFFPRPVWLILLTTPLFAMGSVSDTIRTGYFRDIFSKSTWEHGKHGGASGIVARFGIAITIWAGFSVIVNLIIFFVIAGGNEFTKCRCPEHTYVTNRTITNAMVCGPAVTQSCADAEGGVCKYPDPRGCVPDMEPGSKYCNGSETRFQGGVGVSMLIGFVCEVLALIYWYFVMPETLRPTEKTEATAKEYVKEKKCDSKSVPWNNLRPVFCSTKLLRVLMIILICSYVLNTTGEIGFAWMQEKHGIDSGLRAVLAGIGGFFNLCVAICVLPIMVDKFGDVHGIWIPFLGFLSLQLLLSAILPPSNGNVIGFAIISIVTCPTGLAAGAEGLLLKLIPMDIQATVKSGRAALLGLVRIFMPFVWYAVYFNVSRCFDIANPMRSIHLIFCALMAFCCFALITYNRKLAPHKAFKEGRGLEEFYNSDYAKGPWFQYHSSGNYEAFVKEYGDKAAETAVTVTLPPTNQVVVSSAPVVVVNSAPVIVQQAPVIVQQSTPVIVKQEIDA